MPIPLSRRAFLALAGAAPLASVLAAEKPAPQGYRVLLGEGIGPWKRLFDVAEAKGGVEYYLVEQEGSRFSPLETAQRCLETFRKLRG
jgi:sugar phosphate isomerase/epimerase